jgi:hypothetical protein
MTKVMNEGWATYWHSKLMTEHFLEDAEIIDYAEQHSGVVHMPPGGFNPYKIGVELFKDIERRWDRGQHGAEWEAPRGHRREGALRRRVDEGAREDLRGPAHLQRRQLHRRVPHPEFVEKHQMYQFRRDPRTGEVKVVTRDFRIVKQTLLYRITNMGQPFVYVADGNYLNRGELYLAHEFNGLEVDAAKAVDVLRGLCDLGPARAPAGPRQRGDGPHHAREARRRAADAEDHRRAAEAGAPDRVKPEDGGFCHRARWAPSRPRSAPRPTGCRRPCAQEATRLARESTRAGSRAADAKVAAQRLPSSTRPCQPQLGLPPGLARHARNVAHTILCF